ncbi:hypothetical protein AAIA72_12890 [Hahella sp. SMD15-11]|uniref:CHASE domain-containing protein n=1 Tax=Thermohahella caldifontis TaxID=3142973 RepID=A0AB39UU37_9GAMM
MQRNGFALSLPAAFVLIVGFSLSAMATWLVSNRHWQHAREHFVEAATSRYLALRHDLDSLIAACSLLTSPPSRPLSNRLKTLQAAWPAVSTLEWMVPDPPADNPPAFRIADASPASYRVRLETADFSRTPGISAMLAEAWTGRMPRVTAVTQLNSSEPDYRGEVRILVPAFRVTDSAGESSWPAGLYAVSLDLQRWLTNQMHRFTHDPLRIELYDLAWHTSEPVVAAGQADLSGTDGEAQQWLYTNVLTLPGREWLMRIRPTSGFVAESQSRLPLILFLSGTLITVLIALLISPASAYTETGNHALH